MVCATNKNLIPRQQVAQNSNAVGYYSQIVSLKQKVAILFCLGILTLQWKTKTEIKLKLKDKRKTLLIVCYPSFYVRLWTTTEGISR